MLIAIIVPIAGTLLLQQQDVKESISNFVLDATGRHLSIDGSVGFSPGVSLKLFAEDVRYENAAWSEAASALTVDRIEVDISLRRLLSGELVIESAALVSPHLWLEANDQGDLNVFEPGTFLGNNAENIALPEWLDIEYIELREGLIEYQHPQRTWQISIREGRLVSEGVDQPIDIDVIGGVQGIPLTVDGTMGTLETIVTKRPSLVSLAATIANSQPITLEGVVEDVLGWRGVDVEIAGHILRLTTLRALFFAPPLDAQNVNVHAKLIQPQGVSSMALMGIDTDFDYYGLPMVLDGEIRDLDSLEGFAINVRADDIIDMSNFGISQFPLLKPTVSLAMQLSGTSDSLSATIESAVVKTESAQIAVGGVIHNLSEPWQEPLNVDLVVNNLREFGDVLQLALPDVGEIQGTGQLFQDPSGLISLKDIAINGENSSARITAVGALHDFTNALNGELRLYAEASEGFFTSNQYALPLVPKQLQVDAILNVEDGLWQLGFENIVVNGEGVKAIASGEIPDLSSLQSMQLDISGEVDDIEKIYGEEPWKLPKIKPIAFDMKLIGADDGTWNIEDVHARTKDAEQDIEAQDIVMQGTIKDLAERQLVDLQVSVKVPFQDVVAQLSEQSLFRGLSQEIGRINTAFRVTNARDEAWSVSEIKGGAEWQGAALSMHGGLDSLSPLSGELSVQVFGEDSWRSRLLSDLSIPLAVRSFDRISSRFKVVFQENTTSVKNLDLFFNAGDGVIKIMGGIDSLYPLRSTGLRLMVESDDIASLLPEPSALKQGLSANAALDFDIDEDEISMSGALTIGDSDIAGELSLQTSESDKITYFFQGDSENMHLGELLKEEGESDRFFDYAPLFPSWLYDANGELVFSVKNFSNNTVAMNDMAIKVGSTGEMTQLEIDAVAGDGAVAGRLRRPSNGPMELELTATDIPMTAVKTLAENGLFKEGDLSVEIILAGPGDSLGSLVDNGGGHLHFDINNSRIYSKALDVVGGDILTNLLRAINPFKEKEEFVNVDCGAVYFRLQDGKAIAENGLGLVTSRVSLLGSGGITFPSEVIDIAIAPKPRRGLGISAATVAKLIHIGGSLSAPKIQTDAKGWLKTGAALGAAIVSGGVTLLAQGVFDRVQARSDICAVARGETAIAEDDNSENNTEEPQRGNPAR